MYSRLPVWAPSPVADPLFREVPKAVTRAEIDEIVAGYALVAEHCAEGGFDGIELQCSHSLDRPRLPVPGHEPAHRRVRRLAREPGPPPPRDRRRRAQGDRQPAGARRAAVRRRADRGRHDDRRRGRGRPRSSRRRGHVDYINTSIGVATASLFMIEASMHIPPGYAMFIPSAIRKAVDLPGRRCRSLQGSAAGRTGPRRGPLRSRRRGARADRRRRLRRQGSRRRHRRDPPVPVVQPGMRRAGWASTAGSAASRTRAPAARRERRRRGVRVDGRAPQRGDGRRRRAGRPAGGDRRGRNGHR